MGRKEQEGRNCKRAVMNYHYEKEEPRFSHDTHYDKVMNREESVDVFAQIDTRKLENETLLQ